MHAESEEPTRGDADKGDLARDRRCIPQHPSLHSHACLERVGYSRSIGWRIEVGLESGRDGAAVATSATRGEDLKLRWQADGAGARVHAVVVHGRVEANWDVKAIAVGGGDVDEVLVDELAEHGAEVGAPAVGGEHGAAGGNCSTWSGSVDGVVAVVARIVCVIESR